MPAKSTAKQGPFSRPRSRIRGISGSKGVAKNRGIFGNPRIESARSCGLERALNRSPTFGGAFGEENTPITKNIGRQGKGDPVSPRTPFTATAHVFEGFERVREGMDVQDSDMMMGPALPQAAEEDISMVVFGKRRIGSAHSCGLGWALKRSPTFGGENTPATGSIGLRGSGNSVSPRTPLADIAHVLGAFERRGREIMGVQHRDMMMTPARPQAEEEDTCMGLSPNPIRGMKNRKPQLPKVLGGSEFLTPHRNLLVSIDAIENQVLEELQKLKRKRGKGKRKVGDVCFRRSLRMAFEDCVECEGSKKGLKQMIASLKRLGLL